ncbi:hypothetical protein DL765_005378 [Monosporascus sp. GIB2]|nr:hypothetical protein DL765_005378 [Monosporascus sp. GIB2]
MGTLDVGKNMTYEVGARLRVESGMLLDLCGESFDSTQTAPPPENEVDNEGDDEGDDGYDSEPSRAQQHHRDRHDEHVVYEDIKPVPDGSDKYHTGTKAEYKAKVDFIVAESVFTAGADFFWESTKEPSTNTGFLNGATSAVGNQQEILPGHQHREQPLNFGTGT